VAMNAAHDFDSCFTFGSV